MPQIKQQKGGSHSAPPAPPAPTTVTDGPTLVAALATAMPGSSIQLTAGAYTGGLLTPLAGPAYHGVLIDNVNGGSNASITILGATGAYIQGLLITATSANLIFSNVDFHIPPDPSPSQQYIQIAGTNITFSSGKVRSDDTVTVANAPWAVLMRGASRVVFSGVEFHHVHAAIQYLDSSNITVQNCFFHDNPDDCMRGGGVAGLTITGNRVENCHQDASDGDHPDCCQMWSISTSGPSSNVLVDDNFYARGSVGGAIQGWPFMQNDKTDPHVTPYPYHTNVTITNNIAAGCSYWGCGVEGAQNVTINNNVYQADSRPVAGQGQENPWIAVDRCATISITNNVTSSAIMIDYYASQLTPPIATTGLTQSGNTIAGAFSDGGTALLATWLARKTRLWTAAIA